jgi:tetratricopeptide (TPR) repeat protein
MAPREKEAQIELYKAQENFQNDSLQLALNGNGTTSGFLNIIDDYSGTKAANLSRYYAGICYLNLGDFDEAIRQLDKFSSSDEVFGPLAKGAIGDAFMELNQPKEALEYYQKASKASKNNFVIPMYLMKAGQVAEMQGNLKLALENFKKIESEYKDSREASGIRRHLGRIEGKIANPQ